MTDSKKKILVMDDDPEMLGMISQFLETSGYEVITASDGQAGLQIAVAQMPDLVLTDIQMPNLDGWVVCNRLKTDAKTKHIPVIMMSGLLAHDSEADKAIEKCDYLLAKPVEMKNLLEKVREIFS